MRSSQSLEGAREGSVSIASSIESCYPVRDPRGGVSWMARRVPIAPKPVRQFSDRPALKAPDGRLVSRLSGLLPSLLLARLTCRVDSRICPVRLLIIQSIQNEHLLSLHDVTYSWAKEKHVCGIGRTPL